MEEYGGYLPLELRQGKEYFEQVPEIQIQRLHCARSALYCALLSAKPSRVYIPYYNSETGQEPFERLGIPTARYYISDDFMPKDVYLQPGEYLLWINYFGIINKNKIETLVENYGRVIVDNTQSFFSQPIRNAYQIYSCRKFLGVSDGAYLIGNQLKPIPIPRAESYNVVGFLIRSLLEGTNQAYQQFLENEKHIFDKPYSMSRLTQRILCSIDYENIKRIRRDNFRHLHKIFGSRNALQFSLDEQVPMVYPLLLRDKDIHDDLVRQHVYVPRWWGCVLDFVPVESFEAWLSRYLIPLPIDQRYGEKEMERISQIVLKCL